MSGSNIKEAAIFAPSHICSQPQIIIFICLIAYHPNDKEMREYACGNWLESKTHLPSRKYVDWVCLKDFMQDICRRLMIKYIYIYTHICLFGTLVPLLWVSGLHQCRGSADEARELTVARGLIPSSIGFIQKATRQENLIPSCGAPLQRGLLERCCGK